MKLQLLYLVTILWLAFVASHAAISPEVYWKVKLPNTQIPKVIKDFLPQTVDEVGELKQDETDTKEKLYYGLHQPYGVFGWHRAAIKDKVRDLKQDDTDTKEKVYYGLHVPFGVIGWHRAATKNEVRDLKQDDTEAKEKVYYGLHQPFGVFFWHRAATKDEVRELKQDDTDAKEKVYYGLHQLFGVIGWHRAATEDEVRDLKQQSLSMDHASINNYLQEVTEGSNAKNDLKDDFLYRPYFLEKDLEKGKVINFPSLKNKNEAPFLPRQFVESIPFSSEKIPQILNQFSIESSSKDAQAIKETIKLCEEPEMKEEKKKCATSLESMVDFSVSVLGTNNIMAITTEVEGDNQMRQRYTIEEVRQVADGDNMVCHKLNYAYAVHYCHVGGSTKTYRVSMVGADGTKVEAVSVCHKDTSFWNPKGLPFVVVNVKPGTAPICHFLQDDQVVFVPSKEAN